MITFHMKHKYKLFVFYSTMCYFIIRGEDMDKNKFYRKFIVANGIADKTALFDNYVGYMLNRSQSMFEYKGLPDTIPANILELMLQTKGFAVITDKFDGNLYAYSEGVGLGGELDEYYRPTKAVIANPYQKFNATLTIGEDCELILNDTLFMGLVPLYERYAELLVENVVSMRTASVNSRLMAVLTAGTDRTKTGLEKFLTDLYDGKLGAMLDDDLINGIKIHPIADNSRSRLFTELIEYHQYLSGAWYGEIGVEAAYNMKRERLTKAESGLNTDSTVPLAMEFLNCRKRGFDKVNQHYSTNISVDFASVWRGLDEVNSKPLENEDSTDTDTDETGGIDNE